MADDSFSVSFAPTDLAQIINLAPSFMVLLRGPEFVVEVANKAYEQLVGHRRLIGLPIREALPEVEGQGFFELLDHVFKTGTAWVGSATPVRLQRVPSAPTELRYLDFVYQVLRPAANKRRIPSRAIPSPSGCCHASIRSATGHDIQDDHAVWAR